MADVKISGLPASTVPLAGTEVLPIVQGGATKQVSIANVTAGRAVAALSVTTDTYKAASSSGGALQNSGGTPQLQWGAGGGNNLSVDVAININPANAAVAISPTGTGTVAISPAGALTINPTTASTINNMSIGATTASTGRFTSVTTTTGSVIIGTSGQGIDFSATAHPAGMTSELLNDYETGTWTPTITPQSGSLTTYTSSGVYTKIGNQLTVFGFFTISNGGTAAGVCTVSGLPYSALNFAGSSAAGTGLVIEDSSSGSNFPMQITDNATTAIIAPVAPFIVWSVGFRYNFSATYLVQ
jgi:hypothetical protein